MNLEKSASLWSFGRSERERATQDFAELAGTVQEPRLEADLTAFSGMGSRVSGYPGNARAAQYVRSALESLGFQQDPTHCSPICEVTFAYFDPDHPAYQFYRPRPWMVKFLNFNPTANIEIVLIKREVEP